MVPTKTPQSTRSNDHLNNSYYRHIWQPLAFWCTTVHQAGCVFSLVSALAQSSLPNPNPNLTLTSTQTLILTSTLIIALALALVPILFLILIFTLTLTLTVTLALVLALNST
ncbi:hypothetical protein PoB_004257600 [Plakobranchus ocellatus]|uniref:Uncharacterized protein n=1 Tax=Plakobranchus ocellatus TaxID=259542 RepID=A0AAV4B6J2_9GAST|nr:hypothetical protein PoB_004257600 [Plakobranchus ocellatus]